MSDLVTRAEVGRFLRVPQGAVDRMIEVDVLPVVEVPGPTKMEKRIYLPDFHAWLLRGVPMESGLRRYEEFLRSFRAAQPRGRKEAA